MSKIKTPQEKKRLGYKKDHVVLGGENNKSFRKKWPRKKARINRAYRHKIAQVLATPGTTGDDETDTEAKSINRPKPLKWGVMSLKEAVMHRQESRMRNQGAKIARAQRLVNTPAKLKIGNVA